MAATAAWGRVTAARCKMAAAGPVTSVAYAMRRTPVAAALASSGGRQCAPGGVAAEPPGQRELRGDQAGVEQAADRVVRVAVPRRARRTGRVQQQVVAAQQARRDRQQPGALDQGRARPRAARGGPAAAPGAAPRRRRPCTRPPPGNRRA